MKTRSFLSKAGLVLATALTVSYSGGGKENDISNYKTVVIGKQTWMAENLNHEAEGSKCYDNNPDNCAKYGRLYNWKTAMAVCPKGWHLPSKSASEYNSNYAYYRDMYYDSEYARWDDDYGKSALFSVRCLQD